ncbi:MAG: hypothetical protein ACYDC2_00895, partial [Solirubrobacteraceae bacterium]
MSLGALSSADVHTGDLRISVDRLPAVAVSAEAAGRPSRPGNGIGRAWSAATPDWLRALTVSDYLWSLFTVLVTTAVYVATFFNPTWGTLGDYGTAFLAGLTGKVAINWAALPIFSSVRLRLQEKGQGAAVGGDARPKPIPRPRSGRLRAGRLRTERLRAGRRPGPRLLRTARRLQATRKRRTARSTTMRPRPSRALTPKRARARHRSRSRAGGPASLDAGRAVRKRLYLQTMLLNELTDGAEVDQVLLVKEAERRRRRDGGDYLRLQLGDRTGTVVCMVWEELAELAQLAGAGAA